MIYPSLYSGMDFLFVPKRNPVSIQSEDSSTIDPKAISDFLDQEELVSETVSSNPLRGTFKYCSFRIV